MSRFVLLAEVLLTTLATVPVRAQTNTNPDFSNVNDILRGQRTLVQSTDVEVIGTGMDSNGNYGYFVSTSLTSNSTLGNPGGYLSGSIVSANELTFLDFSGRMFNQAQAVTVVITQQGGAYTVRNAQKLDQDESSGDFNFPPNAKNITHGVMADFNRDGYDDLVITYDDGSIQIGTASDVNSPDRLEPLNFGPIAGLDVLLGITAGDFNGDGQPEIAGLVNLPAGGLALVIYTVDPKTLAVSRAAQISLPKLGQASVGLSVTAGRLTSLAHDQLIVANTAMYNVANTTLELIDFSDSSLTPQEETTYSFGSGFLAAGGLIKVKTGKFGLPDNQYDQVVFLFAWHGNPGSAGNLTKYLNVLSINPTTLAWTAHGFNDFSGSDCAFDLAVGNFDNQQPDPLNPGKTEHNPNAQIASLQGACNGSSPSLVIFSVDPTTFGITTDSAVNLPFAAGPQLSMVATDIQGRSMVLGEPTKVTLDNTKPDIINAAPPMHADYITPAGGTKPQMLNISFIPDGFNSSFSLTQSSTTSASTTGTVSWSAGVSESASASFEVGDVDAGSGIKGSAAFKAAQNFTGSKSSTGSNFSKSAFDISATTKKGDVVLYTDSRLNIWVYPVIGQTVCPATAPNCSPDQRLPLTFQFSGPDQIVTGITSTEDSGAYWYQPPWEFGNVFSYPATTEQLALIYPDLASTQLSNDVTFKTSPSSVKIETAWSSGAEQGSTAATADNFSFSASTTFVVASGAEFIGDVTTKESVKVSGSYGFDNLQTNTSQMDASNGIGILSSAIFPDTSNYGYKVSPFILGNSPPSGVGDSTQPPQANIRTFGPLKTAFTADPIDSQLGGAWWSQLASYGAAPDIALNHPNRWVLTEPGLSNPIPPNCANTGTNASQMDCVDIADYYDQSTPAQPLNPWISNFQSMRGFFITSPDNPGAGPQLGYANAGDKLDLAVRVYNYSLAPMVEGNRVHVRFYAMPWNHLTNVQAADSILIGETVADPVPPFSDSPGAPLNWQMVHCATPFDTTRYPGQWFAFWVVVWMEDGNGNLVKEIEGHGLTSIPGTLTKPSDVALEMAVNTNGKPASYSNNVGFYHYAFPVLAPEFGLGAPVTENPADITLKSVSAARKRLEAGELDEITALLRADNAPARRLKVYFYDGNPDASGTLIGTETASFEPCTFTTVRFPYHPPSDGVHRIWAVINKGTPHQAERHTSAILVGRPRAHHKDWDGDDSSSDETAGTAGNH